MAWKVASRECCIVWKPRGLEKWVWKVTGWKPAVGKKTWRRISQSLAKFGSAKLGAHIRFVVKVWSVKVKSTNIKSHHQVNLSEQKYFSGSFGSTQCWSLLQLAGMRATKQQILLKILKFSPGRIRKNKNAALLAETLMGSANWLRAFSRSIQGFWWQTFSHWRKPTDIVLSTNLISPQLFYSNSKAISLNKPRCRKEGVAEWQK